MGSLQEICCMKTATIQSPAEFERMLLNESRQLRMLALQLTRDSNDADDLVQDTMLKALKHQDKFSEGSNLKAWLYTILRNTFINNYRRLSRRNTFIDSSDNTYFLDLPAHKTKNLGELTFIRKDLEEAIEGLPKEIRVTFLLNMEGFKYHEIAEELGIPIGTVKTRIFVARRLLRKKLYMYAADSTNPAVANE